MARSKLTPVSKKFRDRARRYQRALAAEKRRYGQIDDGAGKRYLIGPLYALAGDLQAALAHYAWFEREVPDDCGEPISSLWWALALYRSGEAEKARARLLETMVQNLYLLPAVIGAPVQRYDMWHGSNWRDPDYLLHVPGELVPDLSEAERRWIREQLESDRFRRVRDEYVSTFHALKSEQEISKRRAILRRWEDFWSRASD
jgi:hypothetical protein